MTAQSVGGLLEKRIRRRGRNDREVGECERDHQNDGKRVVNGL